MGAYQWFLYLLFTLMVMIVSFNLLISIVSDTYDRVQSEEKATDITSKVQILLNYGELKQFITRKKGEIGYLHFFHYNDHFLAGNPDEAVQTHWEGKVKKLHKLQECIAKDIKEIRAEHAKEKVVRRNLLDEAREETRDIMTSQAKQFENRFETM